MGYHAKSNLRPYHLCRALHIQALKAQREAPELADLDPSWARHLNFQVFTYPPALSISTRCETLVRIHEPTSSWTNFESISFGFKLAGGLFRRRGPVVARFVAQGLTGIQGLHI